MSFCEHDDPEDANEQYIQCYLKKCNAEQIAWIPAQFAFVGRVLKIKQQDDIWEDGWKIVSLYAVKTGRQLCS